jgi:hypothetical protein
MRISSLSAVIWGRRPHRRAGRAKPFRHHANLLDRTRRRCVVSCTTGVDPRDFPGLVYQLGNFLASANANIQVWLAERFEGDYGVAPAIVIGVTAVVIAVSVSLGREPKGTRMGADLG